MIRISLTTITVVGVLGTTGCGAMAPKCPESAREAKASYPKFIEDDYARALAEARAAKKPLFIDAWAPWCHTCLSMRSFVFNDAALSPIADKLIWLAIDTEKPENAPFLAKYPMNTWPTLWVVDAEHETPTLKWPGSATAPELAQLLTETSLDSKSDAATIAASASFLRGKRASAAGTAKDAIAEYRAALTTAPANWTRRPQASEALASALEESKDRAACVEFARTQWSQLARGTSRANVAASGLRCALDSAGTIDASARAALVSAVTQIAHDAGEPILADDRSSLFEMLVSMYADAKDDAAAKRTAAAWAAVLEREASRATTPGARAVFDAHRLEAYFALGVPERALPMLNASKQDFPSDYNPRFRLARAYLELRNFDEALAAVDEALARVYGGRELRVRSVKVDILLARGDAPAAKEALRESMVRAKAMNLAPNYAKLSDAMAKRLAALEHTVNP
jgi:thiol-disulfide isomerase/thioredoxin